MTLQVAISPQTALDGLRTALTDLFGVPGAEVEALSRRPLDVCYDEIRNAIKRALIQGHPLYDILNGALDDLAHHAAAIVRIGDSPAILLHVRHIEEVVTVLAYLVKRTDLYSEFAWRWTNFKVAHGIRSRLLNLKQPLDPVMQTWIKSNIANLKKVSSKFTGDPQKDLPAWEKYQTWLTPYNLKDIFETAGNKDSYVSQMYDWNSQSVHFSPLGEYYPGFELSDYTYLEVATELASYKLHSLLRILLPVSVSPDDLRDLHARLVLLDMYKMIDRQPERFGDLMTKRERFKVLLAEIARSPQVKSRLIAVTLGAPPVDPLVIKPQ